MGRLLAVGELVQKSPSGAGDLSVVHILIKSMLRPNRRSRMLDEAAEEIVGSVAAYQVASETREVANPPVPRRTTYELS
jgi:hypothetical protein